MLARDRALARDQTAEKIVAKTTLAPAGNLAAQSVLLIAPRALDNEIFENESVFPAVERSAATDATHFRINRRYGLDLHQRILCRAVGAVEHTRA
jgi:hypothetical protein